MKKYGESTINKYIPFINRGRKIERERILKIIKKMHIYEKIGYYVDFIDKEALENKIKRR